ncbi:hypothetical protein EPN95_02310 [Patescibacteria group bacterium]|nr:MAG: hypothetical protein EPN95_02310 [Patescibacteria group bacterium]
MYVSVLQKSRKFLPFLLLLGILLVLIFLKVPTPVHATTGINQQINFQGRLLTSSGATVPDGFYNIQFKIYQDGDGLSVGDSTGSPTGALKWTESYLNNNSQGVQVINGFMSVQLGSITPFGSSVDWNQSTLWLSMNIGSTNATCTPFTSCTPDGEMIPMKRMSSSPYALNSGLLGGLASTNFLQLAQGVQTDASTNTNSIYLNKTGSGGNFLDLQSAGVDALLATNTGDIKFGTNTSTHTISVNTASASSAGTTLNVTAGAAGTGGSALAGGNLVLQGGAGGGANGNGGNITLIGGIANGTGTQGLINLSASAFTTVTNTTCSSSCTITQANVDNYGAVIVNASTSGITITLPPPTNTTTTGRILYITTASGGSDFTLSTNTGGNVVNVAMRQNTTATMIWNGSAWTPGGASNATTLQAVYSNGTNPSTTPEIKLDSTHGTIDIQDADTSIAADIFDIHGSNVGTLGTVLFGVGSDGRVTIQGTSNAYSAFRVLNSTGNYLFNINSNNNYILDNAIKTPGNDISNPNFETGGSITGGEEGWFGTSQASIVNDASNANSGNYELQVTPNGTNLDVYAGTYQEVKPGDNIAFQGYVKNSGTANGTGGIQITWYDKDKNVLSNTTNYSSLPGTSYILKTINTTVPSTAYYMQVSAAVRSTATAGTYYFDDFYMRKSSESAAYTFRNSQDSTAAFQIQSASSAQTLFTADTSNNILKVGDSTGTDTATTLFVLDGATANPTTSLSSKNGGLFYRSDTNSLKAVIGGSVVDICTTAVTCSGYSASASSSIQLQGSSPGTAQTGNFNITGTGILTQLQTQDQSSSSTNSSALVIRSGNAAGTTSNSGNLTLDVGTATGTTGSITIGHSGVSTTMAGTLAIQGASTLSLGASSTNIGSVLFYTSAGANTVTLKASGANPTASWNLTLPQNPGNAGDCLKDSSGTGTLAFGNCAAGITVNLQDTYNNSSSPATITLADSKDLKFVAQDTTTDPNVLINLQCVTSCGTNGRFAVQNGGTDVFTISPNGTGITLAQYTQIGSSTTDSTQVNFQLDSYNQTTDSGTCSTTVNQGAMYYNTSMGSIRACVNGSWGDVSNPDTLGLLTFGIVPSSGTTPYDLPALVTSGVSGPCKVSWASATSVTIQSCIAYSGGRRVNVTSTTLTTNSATTNNISLTTTNRWGHICLTGSNSQPAFTTTAGQSAATSGMPTYSSLAPILCLADVLGSSTTGGNIANIYDVRTFTSSLKEAVTVSTAVELGMLVDAGTGGAMTPAVANSQKLYGLVVATNGSTSSGTPNTIVTTVGSGWIKATAGTAGQFTTAGTTNGYSTTVASIPNNSFYYSGGNTRTSYAATCTSASNCSGSLYTNFIVR